MLGVRRCPAWSALRESRAEWRALVRLRRESCEMEKKIQAAYLRKRFGRNIPQAETRFPPGGAMRNALPDKLVYLQATPPTTNDLANAAMPRPTARPEAAYSAELERRVKAKEFNLKAGIGKVRAHAQSRDAHPLLWRHLLGARQGAGLAQCAWHTPCPGPTPHLLPSKAQAH